MWDFQLNAIMHMFKYLFCLLVLFNIHFNALANFPDLPEPVTNNAVASVEIKGQTYLFSFMGLGDDKDYQAVHNKAWQLVIKQNGKFSDWESIPSVPSSLKLKGRLASVAVGLNQHVFIFGGYTVAEDHTEISTPDVYKYDPLSQSYTKLSSMPVPVDDAVALTYQNRYIYLISGWHNDGNVNLVQVYDVEKKQWRQASPFLGSPVFGHAGGIIDNTMVICDGVKVIANSDKRRTFSASPACYSGNISVNDPLKIDWRTLPHPSGSAHYRMAAIGDNKSGKFIFFGGAQNPYNYNGVGYDAVPSQASNKIWLFDLSTQSWETKTLPFSSMDHRGLLPFMNQWVILGGMGIEQNVLKAVNTFELSSSGHTIEVR